MFNLGICIDIGQITKQVLDQLIPIKNFKWRNLLAVNAVIG